MPNSTLKDPLDRVLVMHDRTWYGHIVRGHPEVGDHRTLVEKALESPDEIRISRSDSDCRLNFGQGPHAGLTMMVVADVVRGIVKTAHLCKRVSGGRQEWSK